MSRKKSKKTQSKNLSTSSSFSDNRALSHYQACNSLESALRLTDYDLTNMSDLSTLGAYDNIKIDLITLHPVLLTFLFKTYGILAKTVTLPVEDAYRGNGFVLECDIMDDKELLKFQQEAHRIVPVIKQGRNWSRLFGGSALICLDGKPLNEPLIYDNLQGKQIKFIAVDRWQLSYSFSSVNIRGGQWTLANYDTVKGITKELGTDTSALTIDDSRVKILHGVDSPFITNNMVQGWGLSVYEQIFKEMSTYFKGQNAFFELLDESKIDVIKLAAMDLALSSSAGERALEKTVDLIARSQNYKSKLLLSTNDQYEQKQISFGGLDGVSREIRAMISGASNIPVNKLWGEGVTGFGSGQDSLENYNSLIETSIRTPDSDIWEWILKILSYSLFGVYEEGSITQSWNALRVLSSIDEQNINDHKFANIMQLFDRKLLTPQETMEALNRQKLFRQDTKALRGELENVALYNQTPDTPDDNGRNYNITDIKDVTV